MILGRCELALDPLSVLVMLPRPSDPLPIVLVLNARGEELEDEKAIVPLSGGVLLRSMIGVREEPIDSTGALGRRAVVVLGDVNG